MGLVILMMVFHIINSLRAKQLGEALFDTNGVAGLVFYGAVAAVVVLYMTGNALPAGIVLVAVSYTHLGEEAFPSTRHSPSDPLKKNDARPYPCGSHYSLQSWKYLPEARFLPIQ